MNDHYVSLTESPEEYRTTSVRELGELVESAAAIDAADTSQVVVVEGRGAPPR